MGERMNETILELYDGAKDKEAQIKSMAKMLGITEGHVKRVLRDNGRIPKRQYKTRHPAESADEAEAAVPKDMPMPDIIKALISDKLDEIEADLQAHKKKIAELEAEYKTISNYMKGITP